MEQCLKKSFRSSPEVDSKQVDTLACRLVDFKYNAALIGFCSKSDSTNEVSLMTKFIFVKRNLKYLLN